MAEVKKGTEHFKNESGEFEGIYVAALLFKHKWWVISSVFVLTVASVIISYILPVYYKSTVNVVPPQGGESGLGGAMSSISSALQDFGLTKLGGVEGQSYTFLVILQSRTVIDSMINKFDLDEVYDIPMSSDDDIRMKFQGNTDVSYEKEGNYYISVWDKDKQRAAEMANYYVDIANDIAIRLYREENRLSREHMEMRIAQLDSLLNNLSDSLETFSRETMLFAPQEQAKALSESIAEIKTQKIQNEIMYKFFSQNFGDDYPQSVMYENILGQLDKKLNSIQNDPGFAGNFALRNAGEHVVKYMKLYTEFETYSKVKAYLLPMLEKANVDIKKQIKNLYVIDRAIPADRKDKPRRSFIVAGTFIGSFVLVVLVILLIYGLKNLNNRYKEVKDRI